MSRQARGWLWGALALAAQTQARAQVVERHLPSAPPPVSAPLPTPPAPSTSADDRELGAKLAAIALLAAGDPVAENLEPGIAVSPALTRVDPAKIKRALAGYLGKPLSRRLISQAEAKIVQAYRRRGFPFVEVSTPEQEIGQGALRIRVVEFRLAKLDVSGVSKGEAARVAKQIRLRPGQTIDSRRLSQDLDWLDRDPFESVQPAFTPGAALGDTNLDLAVAPRRPWRIEAGYSNAGASPSSQDRYFVDATVGIPRAPGAVLSLQLTASPDFWGWRGQPFGRAHPIYESAAGRFSTPLGPRQDLELTVDAVETNQPVEAFVVRQQTLEATLAYRAAVSNFLPAPGDIRLGIEAKSQRRMTFFGPVDVLNGAVNVYQVAVGWSDAWSDRWGRSSFDLAVRAAPGGLDRLSGDAALGAFTNARVTGAGYAYADLDYSRSMPISGGSTWIIHLMGQYAGRPLPDSEQFGLGGPGAVRGYFLDVGAFDDAGVLRDELHGPNLPFRAGGAGSASVEPFAFIDVGYGRNEATRMNTRLASVGFGANLAVGGLAIANLSVSCPFVTTHDTVAGDWRLDVRVSIAY